MSELDFNDFFKQVKKDRDDRLAKALIKQSELEEDLFWENYMKEDCPDLEFNTSSIDKYLESISD